MKIRAYLIILILFIGFITNLIWENVQAFLYEGFDGFVNHFFMCLVASVIDALVTLLIYLLVAFIYKDLHWTKYKSWMPLGIIGGIVAVVFEKWTLTQLMWSYRENVPVVPLVGIGLSSFIQLMILPLLTFYFSSVLLNCFVLRK